MAKPGPGKTTVPLVFVVEPSLFETEDFVGLKAQGHTVHRMDALPEGFDLMTADLLLGPRCCWYSNQMAELPLLDLLIKRARRNRRSAKTTETVAPDAPGADEQGS